MKAVQESSLKYPTQYYGPGELRPLHNLEYIKYHIMVDRASAAYIAFHIDDV